MERLDAYRQALTLEKVPDEQQFDHLKALFSADVDARAAAADKTDTDLRTPLPSSMPPFRTRRSWCVFATELTAKLVYLVVYPELWVRCVFRA